MRPELYIKQHRLYSVYRPVWPGHWELWLEGFATRLDALVAGLSLNEHRVGIHAAPYAFRVCKRWWGGEHQDAGHLYSPAHPKSYAHVGAMLYDGEWTYAVDHTRRLIFNGTLPAGRDIHTWSMDGPNPQGGTRAEVVGLPATAIMALPDLVEYAVVSCVWELDHPLWVDPAPEFALEPQHAERLALAQAHLLTSRFDPEGGDGG